MLPLSGVSIKSMPLEVSIALPHSCHIDKLELKHSSCNAPLQNVKMELSVHVPITY